MAKYIIVLVVLIAAGGVFLYTTQTAEAPVQTPIEVNPFGEGANVVGGLEDETENEIEDEEEDVQTTGGTGATGGSTGTGTTGGAASVITRTQLATHNKQNDCWVGYKTVVYDITSWLPRHPGSAAAIAPYCGTSEEFTAAFTKQHGTSKESRLKKEGTVEGTLGQ